MDTVLFDSVLFDLGAVLIDWNPRYLYRPLFNGDEKAMEHFLAEIAPPWWNLEIDAGKTFDQAVACFNSPEYDSAAAFRRNADLAKVQVMHHGQEHGDGQDGRSW